MCNGTLANAINKVHAKYSLERLLTLRCTRIFWYIGLLGSPGPEVIFFFSCSTQLSMKFFMLINVKMSTNIGILTFMNRKNRILGLSVPKKADFLDIFYTYEHLKFHSQLN